jgi:hypothetical protein
MARSDQGQAAVDIAEQRKADVASHVNRTADSQKPDFPDGWSTSRTASGRVTRLTYEPKSPIEYQEAIGMTTLGRWRRRPPSWAASPG